MCSEAALLATQAASTSLRTLRLVEGAAPAAAAILVVVVVAPVVVVPSEVARAELVPRRRLTVGSRCEIPALPRRARAILCDVESERASSDLSAVELLDGLLCMLLDGEPNEREASGAARFAVLGNVNIDDFANFSEQLTELLVRRGKVEVPYEYLA